LRMSLYFGFRLQSYKESAIYGTTELCFFEKIDIIDSPKARKRRGSSLAGSPSYAFSLYASTISIAPLKARREPQCASENEETKFATA